MKRSKGSRSQTRDTLSKDVRDKGEPPVTHSLREFEEGDRVSVRIDSAIHRGMPHPRYQGYTGTVSGTQGDCYTVEIQDGGKEKTLIAAPEHLVPQE
jgi:large subunit ribosomal protein L21e